MASVAADQQRLQKFVARRHPMYAALRAHWDFLESTYDGGRDWFPSNIFQYIKEGQREYKKRIERAYRFNHTREVVDLVNKYLFKMDADRDENRAPDSVKKFWKKATLSGLCISEFMKLVSNRASVFGRPWIVVDSTNTFGARTVAEANEAGAQTYAYIVPPQYMLDMSYDGQGKLNWCLIYECDRDDVNPFESSGAPIERYRLWTRTTSQVFTVEMHGNKPYVVPGEEVIHDLGEVPVFPADNIHSDDKWTATSMVADVAYLDRAVANYLSNIDAIIQDQTFSQLIMPNQALEPGTDEYKKLVEMGTKRIFLYNGEGAGKPEYISPDVKQAELILSVINKIINEIYHSVGLAGERTKQDNAVGIDNSSGVAKAYDFERVNALLAAKANALEQVEKRLCYFVALYNGDEAEIQKLDDAGEELVEYPENFDVRGLYDEFEIATRLALVEAPDAVRREQMRALSEKLFPQMKDDLKTAIEADLKSWPPKLEVAAPGASGPKLINSAAAKKDKGKSDGKSV